MTRDRLQIFEDQIAEKRFNGCVGIAIGDVIGNIVGVQMDSDFSEAAAYRVLGQKTGNDGVPLIPAIQGACLYGALPAVDEDFSASMKGELYANEWSNYAQADIQTASRYSQFGYVSLTNYDAVSDYIQQTNWGAPLLMKWYQSFNDPQTDGTLPAPSGSYSIHCVAVYDNPLIGLQIKPSCGKEYGIGGYAYLTRSTFEQVFIQSAGFDPNATRFWTLATIGLTHWNLAPDVLKAMQQLSTVRGGIVIK